MNKLILFGLLTLLFNSINGEIGCQEWTSHFNQADLDEDVCSMLVPTNTGKTHCCYVEINDSPARCQELSDDEYENIDRYIKYREDISPDEDIDIDCSSKFLSLSLIAVAALLF